MFLDFQEFIYWALRELLFVMAGFTLVCAYILAAIVIIRVLRDGR